jgi:hypothetical protein
MLQYIHTQRGVVNSGGSQPGHGLRAIAAIGIDQPPAPMDPAPVAPAAAPGTVSDISSNPSGRGNQIGAHFGHGRYRRN